MTINLQNLPAIIFKGVGWFVVACATVQILKSAGVNVPVSLPSAQSLFNFAGTVAFAAFLVRQA